MTLIHVDINPTTNERIYSKVTWKLLYPSLHTALSNTCFDEKLAKKRRKITASDAAQNSQEL